MRSARLSAYFGNNALTNLGPRLRSTRECKELGGGPRFIQSLSDVSDLGLSRPRVLYIPWFVPGRGLSRITAFSQNAPCPYSDAVQSKPGSLSSRRVNVGQY